MKKHNEDQNGQFFGKLEDNIKSLKDKHLTANREWRYDFAEGRMHTLDELILKSEKSKQDDFYTSKGGED